MSRFKIHLISRNSVQISNIKRRLEIIGFQVKVSSEPKSNDVAEDTLIIIDSDNKKYLTHYKIVLESDKKVSLFLKQGIMTASFIDTNLKAIEDAMMHYFTLDIKEICQKTSAPNIGRFLIPFLYNKGDKINKTSLVYWLSYLYVNTNNIQLLKSIENNLTAINDSFQRTANNKIDGGIFLGVTPTYLQKLTEFGLPINKDRISLVIQQAKIEEKQPPQDLLKPVEYLKPVLDKLDIIQERISNFYYKAQVGKEDIKTAFIDADVELKQLKEVCPKILNLDETKLKKLNKLIDFVLAD